MNEMKLYTVFLLSILCFLLNEPNSVMCDGETFQNTVIKWCNGSWYWSRYCAERTISHSHFLVEKIPSDLKGFEYITIAQQNIPVLYENSIGNIKIYDLEIISCGVTDIEVGAFSNTSIDSLRIKHNKLEKLKRGIFRNASITQNLELIENGIKTIEEGVFEGMHLSSIELSRNNLEEIGTGVFSNIQVESIILGENKLEIIKRDTFRSVKGLQILDLSNNRIKLIESGSFDNLKEVAFVYLMNNLLDTVSEGVYNSKTYVQLILGENKIKSIAQGALDKTAFAYLNLTGNEIKTVKTGILNTNTNIDYLLLADNKIETIEPSALDKVYRGVDLASNHISVIKKGTFKYVRIVILLDNKDLRKIEVGAFSLKELPGDSFYNRTPRTLYLEKDNLLDEESKTYLHNLTSSGKLIWRDKIETNIVFPLT